MIPKLSGNKPRRMEFYETRAPQPGTPATLRTYSRSTGAGFSSPRRWAESGLSQTLRPRCRLQTTGMRPTFIVWRWARMDRGMCTPAEDGSIEWVHAPRHRGVPIDTTFQHWHRRCALAPMG